MKRTFLTIFALLVLGLWRGYGEDIDLSTPAILDVKTEVTLVSGGDAIVYQKWDVVVTTGTEWYIPISNVGKRRIGDLSVYEGDVKFESDGREWDSSRSRVEKMHRCGIVEKKQGAVELCWGQGEPGHHIFEILYVISDLVESMDEGDGFHWHFLNDEWDHPPQHASLTIVNETEGDPWYFNSQEDYNVRAWAFGFKGQVKIEEGEIRIESDEPFGETDFMSVMLLFNKGLFNPSHNAEESFAKLQDKAFNNDFGSDEHSVFFDIIGWILLILAGGGILFVLYKVLMFLVGTISGIYQRATGNTLDKDYFGTRKVAGWYRDIPLGGSLPAAYSLLYHGDYSTSRNENFKNLIGAYFLKWIMEGVMEVEKAEGETVNLKITEQRTKREDSFETRLYTDVVAASGKNRILEANEFVKWSKGNYSEIGRLRVLADEVGKPLWQASSQEERCHLMELKNFLSDYTLSEERSAPEVGIWRKYLIYAQLLGIADKVMENFKKLFPDLAEQIIPTSSTLLPTLNRVASSAVDEADRVASWVASRDRSSSSGSYSSYSSRSDSSSWGGGGSSSYSGGGGGHGGGHGGGSR